MLDLTAEFYLETVQYVFQEHRLPAACSSCSGRRSIRAAIRHTALLTVEGERDDICSPGQTVPGARPVHAASSRCASATTCSRAWATTACSTGARWQQQIYPLVHNLILANTV